MAPMNRSDALSYASNPILWRSNRHCQPYANRTKTSFDISPLPQIHQQFLLAHNLSVILTSLMCQRKAVPVVLRAYTLHRMPDPESRHAHISRAIPNCITLVTITAHATNPASIRLAIFFKTCFACHLPMLTFWGYCAIWLWL